MGQICSRQNSEEERILRDKDNAMEKAIRDANERDNRVIKLLLLGTGECGKSTIFKQMQLIYEQTFSEQEVNVFGQVIRHNTVECMQVLLSAVAVFQEMEPSNEAYHYSSEQAAAGATFILTLDPTSTNLFGDGVAAWIKYLWTEKCVQAAYARRAELQLADCAAYFFDNVERIGAANFTPKSDDILRARLRTSGIVERMFKIHGSDFKFIDVGGQRNERRKWIHCFADVTAIIFITAVSEYDQNLYEDETVNRLRESLAVFNQIVNNPLFRKTTMILFLNKMDLFDEKIKRSSLAKKFPAYTGPEGDRDASLTFIKGMFTEAIQQKDRIISMHTTCATDTTGVSQVFEVCKKTILEAQTTILFGDSKPN